MIKVSFYYYYYYYYYLNFIVRTTYASALQRAKLFLISIIS